MKKYSLNLGFKRLQLYELPYQIKSFEEYLEQYKISIEQPEKFWGGVVLKILHGKRNGVLEWNFKEPRVRDLKALN